MTAHSSPLSWLLPLTAVLILALAAPALAQEGTRPPLPAAARVSGLRFEFQTWCNCGPVNLTMVLSAYGWTHDQQTAAGWLKPTAADKNVSPHELVAYVQHQTELPHLRALWRYGGTLDTIKAFVAAGFPVIVESGFQPEGLEWMGHYITVVAYDDSVQTFWTYDSYLGQDVPVDYSDLDGLWRHFNRLLVLVYPADREAEVLDLLGPLADPDEAARLALQTARLENDGWAQFNAGTSALALGDIEAAARAYDQALAGGLPFRMLWYQFGPFEAYYRAGRYFDVLRLVDQTATITTDLEELALWRGLALTALGYPNEALAGFDTALAFNPNSAALRAARSQVASGEYAAPAPLVIARRPIP